jgi:hypothetical protein
MKFAHIMKSVILIIRQEFHHEVTQSTQRKKNGALGGLGVVSATRRKFFTTDVVWAGSAHYTDYTDFLLFSVLIREIRG